MYLHSHLTLFVRLPIATEPKPANGSYFKKVSSLHDARRSCLDVITRQEMDEHDWIRGQVYDEFGHQLAKIAFDGTILVGDQQSEFPALQVMYFPWQQKLTIISIEFLLSEVIDIDAREVGNCWIQVPQLVDESSIYQVHMYEHPRKGFEVALYPKALTGHLSDTPLERCHLSFGTPCLKSSFLTNHYCWQAELGPRIG